MPHGKSPRHEPRTGKSKAAPDKRRTAHAEESSRTPAASHGVTSPSRGAARGTPKSGRGDAPEQALESSQRLQKLLAAAGFGARREVEQFLRDERVTVNGRVAKLGDRADPRVDVIRVDGERLVAAKPAYWLLHKPRGVVTTVRDEEGRKTVMNLLPSSTGRLFPVGRLDRETSGLLLMTNDGEIAHTLLHPSLGNEREYRVSVKGPIDEKAIGRLEKGIMLEEGRTAPGKVRELRFDPEAGTSSFFLTLVEGRKRQIRRSLLILGFPVRRLVRVRMGPLRLGRLPVGEARPLRPEERRALFDHVDRLRAEGRTAARPRRAAKSPAQRAARSRKGTSK